MAYESFIPGATVVGVTFDDGVILAAEKRITYGRFVVSHAGKKVFKITENVGAACAGLVADMQMLVREISSIVKIRELELRRQLPPNSVAKLMSVVLFERRYYPLLAQTILGGVDSKPTILVLDPLGSVIPDEYASVGSGAEIATGLLESEYRPNMTEDEAKTLVKKAIESAIARDAASGDGVDMLIITSQGIREESHSFR